jgi:hypothetical protein
LVTDEQVFHFAAAVDQDRVRIFVQERVRFARLEVLHARWERERMLK